MSSEGGSRPKKKRKLEQSADPLPARGDQDQEPGSLKEQRRTRQKKQCDAEKHDAQEIVAGIQLASKTSSKTEGKPVTESEQMSSKKKQPQADGAEEKAHSERHDALTQPNWWGASKFVAAGCLGGLNDQDPVKARKSFTEDTQAELYMQTQATKTAGKKGLGSGQGQSAYQPLLYWPHPQRLKNTQVLRSSALLKILCGGLGLGLGLRILGIDKRDVS